MIAEVGIVFDRSTNVATATDEYGNSILLAPPEVVNQIESVTVETHGAHLNGGAT